MFAVFQLPSASRKATTLAIDLRPQDRHRPLTFRPAFLSKRALSTLRSAQTLQKIALTPFIDWPTVYRIQYTVAAALSNLQLWFGAGKKQAP
jgi:hypothetical protein